MPEEANLLRQQVDSHCQGPSSQRGWRMTPNKNGVSLGRWQNASKTVVIFTQLPMLCGLSCSVLSNSFVTPWTVAHQAPLSMGFSRQEYWSGLPCPPPANLPNPGIEPRSPTLQMNSLLSEPPGKPKNTGVGSLSLLQRSCWPRTWTGVSCIAGQFFTSLATRKAQLSKLKTTKFYCLKGWSLYDLSIFKYWLSKWIRECIYFPTSVCRGLGTRRANGGG